jgi:hypothetical protein
VSAKPALLTVGRGHLTHDAPALTELLHITNPDRNAGQCLLLRLLFRLR